MSIRSVGDASTAEVWRTGHSRVFPGNLHEAMLRKLHMVNAAVNIGNQTVPPGNRLKKLEGKRKDDWSIRVNDQWRITFRWSNGNPDSVSVEDYH